MNHKDTDYHDQLEKEITSLKRENNALRREIDTLIHTNMAISMLAGVPRDNEMETLIKDGKRLDFLLNCAYAIQINKGDIVSSREKIDEAINLANQSTV
jgi:hypothetical protein